MGKDILNIYCPGCGTPAKYDIVQQKYHCSHCGQNVTIEAAREEKEQQLAKSRKHVQDHAKDYSMETASCTGCGATLVFEAGEALTNCEFCGRSLARKRYVYNEKLPEYMIPFAVTQEEAAARMQEWCDKNSSKPEARHLQSRIKDLKGYYLPYKMISGPVSCNVRRLDDVTRYEAQGYIENGFVNCSNQLDNLVLDAMEPYDLDGLTEFDFAYVAGQRVKITDIDEKEEKARIDHEVQDNYRMEMNRIWNTRALDLSTTFKRTIHVPALLPVYYISDGGVCAAVNGQTGKVSVRAEKISHYVTPPWWLKSIFILLAYTVITYGLVLWGSRNPEIAAYAGGGYLLFELFLFAFMIRDSYYHWGTHTKYRRIFTSGKETYERLNGELVLREDLLHEKIAEPMFERKIRNDVTEKVYYRFCPPIRMVGMTLEGFLVVLWPILLALVINGFHPEQMDIRGSGIWLLITLITAPVYMIRGAVQWLYENPWIYDKAADGTLTRRSWFSKLRHVSGKQIGKAIKYVLLALIVPPVSLITWLILGILIATVYFTAFGI